MKNKIMISSLFLLSIFLSPLLHAASLSFDVKGMTCAMCAAKVENSVKKVEGVSKCTVDDKTGKGNVEYDASKTSPEKILEACNRSGFNCQ